MAPNRIIVASPWDDLNTDTFTSPADPALVSVRGSMGRSFVARKAGSERCVYDGWFQSSGSSEMCNFDRFTELKTPYILYSKTTSAESHVTSDTDYPQGNIGVADSLAIFALCEDCAYTDKMMMPYMVDPSRVDGSAAIANPFLPAESKRRRKRSITGTTCTSRFKFPAVSSTRAAIVSAVSWSSSYFDYSVSMFVKLDLSNAGASWSYTLLHYRRTSSFEDLRVLASEWRKIKLIVQSKYMTFTDTDITAIEDGNFHHICDNK
ncbi:hypothetical protein EB796_018678 [Bugula neritina]|uniref:Uncharacterized protein n=1 Tax=Bugula neritina TaxID=10212 RepID=A0A7J7J9W1_BUGNE|nr:hypothetical protein EB796_018678 [Bugula neritina]